MPITLSAKRSLRKAEKNHKENVSLKRKLKELLKSFLSKPSQEGLVKVESALDKAVKHKIYHKNKVARLKSQYVKKVEKKDEVKTVKAPVKKAVAKKVASKKAVAKKAAAKKTSKKM